VSNSEGAIITVASASVESPEWAELLIKSIRKYTAVPHEILIIDNGSRPANLTWLRAQTDIRLVELPANIGHGGAMDMATLQARGRYVCFIDIDAHFQRAGWDADLIALCESDPKIRMIGVIGPENKPYHPPLFFYEPQFVLNYGLTFRYLPGVEGSTDTAQKVYWDLISLGYRSERLEKGAHVYDDCGGDEIIIRDKPTIFHSWQGTRYLENRPGGTKAILDGVPLEDYLAGKARVFARPEVKAILGEGGGNE
jgi:glycosyltransferase involved in cell wall biosynthesis